MNYKIIHDLPFIGPKSFGSGPVALNLCREQCRLGCNARIWCLDDEVDRQWAARTVDLPDTNIQLFASSWPPMIGYSLDMEKTARGPTGKNTQIVHQHGIWTGISRTTNIIRQRYGIPTIVAPHGSLEGWAVKKSLWKKQVAMAFYERENLKKASCLHACSHQEVGGFRDFGLSNPVAVIPNGIGASWFESTGSGVPFRKTFGIPESKRILLYLSRITPIKGLPMLMEALGSIRQDLADWVLVIAGADEFGHLKEVQQAVTDNCLQDQVYFTGLLKDQIKRDAFAAADLFVLPTLRENFAIVVAEALGAGVPVVTTQGAPWAELVTCGCGWWPEITSESLAAALQDAFAKTSAELKVMGERGRTLVSTRYTWKRAAQMTIELYEWLLNRRERPEFVIAN